MKSDFLSAELKAVIEMALINHETGCKGRFWTCEACAPLREDLVVSISQENRLRKLGERA